MTLKYKSKMKIVVVLLIIFSSLVDTIYSQEDSILYSFLVADHTYGKPGVNNKGFHPPFKDKFQYIQSRPEQWFQLQKFRLTVDRNIRYQKAYNRPMTDWDYSLEDDRIVVEIKFDAKDFDLKDEITSFMPFRNSKHSKYVTGILMCY